MPARMVREGILTSRRVNRLTEAAEVFYRRLMSVVDDYGRFEADPDLLIAKCYPLRVKTVSADDIIAMLGEVVVAGLVVVYRVGEKFYLELLDFKQRVRAHASMFPSPDGGSPVDAGQLSVICQSDDSHPRASRARARVVDVDVDVDVGVDGKTVAGGVPSAPPAAPSGKPKSASTTKPPTAETWAAYSAAYKARYGIEPLRNATVNGQLANIIGKAGAEMAPAIVAFYVRSNDPRACREKHPVGLLVSTLQKVATEMQATKGVVDGLSPAGRQTAHNLADWTPPEERGQ